MTFASHNPCLFIDTCAPVLQVAIAAGADDWKSVSLPCDSHHSHSSRMIPTIQDLLTEFDILPAQLKTIAVNIGPGSFTGLRTGVVTTRALAQFLPISVYQFNTLELWARHAMHLQEGKSETIAVYMDALRGRAFHAVYQINPTENTLTVLEKPCLKLLTETRIRPGITGTPSCEPLRLPEGSKILASPSLEPWLENRGYKFTAMADTLSTTALMRDTLKSPQGNEHLISWEKLSPLYLQEPSITLKPGFVPLTPSTLQAD